MITPFSQLSWWQKKKFQWKFRDPEYLHLLKAARKHLSTRNEYVCLCLERLPCTQDDLIVNLCRHISQVQGVHTYERWMVRHNMVVGYSSTHWGRKAWVDQMIKALER